MSDSLTAKNAVAAIRVSTTKQGTNGDSPEAQKEQIERFAETKGIVIKKYFVFLESASKAQQPMQEAIDYCKVPKNKVELFIIKSIDRFTRGGSLSYDLLKNQLDACQVSLVDIYGVISATQVNTMEHLGLEYRWSIYSPSKKSEILEAERSKDELRDIMSRMIGAEVRYTRMGYWMRRPPYGYTSEKIDTQNGKRTILRPHPEESKYIIKMFELRATGRYTDREIVEKINAMGYSSRIKYVYTKPNKTKPMKQRGGTLMNDRQLWRLMRNPIYAGVNVEKWTDNEPVKCMFEGLVSIDLFNRANKGKRTIVEHANSRISIYDKQPPEHLTNKGKRSADFPYKKFVMCPQCNKPLLGSASRGKSGKYYPAYHCNKRGHNFRVSKQDLETRVNEFIGDLQISPEKLDTLFKAIDASWEKMNAEYQVSLNSFDERIQALENEATITVGKLKVLSSDTAIKYMEEDLLKIEKEINNLKQQKEAMKNKKPLDIGKAKARIKYFVEHLDELLKKQIDPIKKAQFFGVIFNQVPTYEDIKSRTQKTPQFSGVNSLFTLANVNNSLLVTPAGFEPAIFWMRTRYPEPLDDGATAMEYYTLYL